MDKKKEEGLKTPLDILMDKVEFKCTNCGALMGDCNCWVDCVYCGCSYLQGEECNYCEEEETNARKRTEID